MQVIAINGRKRSGKDTVADYIIDSFVYDVEKVQFAKTLKDLFLVSYNKLHAQQNITYADVDGATDFDREELIDNDLMNPEEVFVDFIYNLSSLIKKEYDETVKFDNLLAILKTSELLKENDQFSVRMYLEYFGTEIAKVSDELIWAKLSVLETINKGVEVVVIPDLRFSGELSLLKEQFGDDLITIKVERKSDMAITHSSDVVFSDSEVDHVINNNGSIIDLYEQVNNILGI